MPSHPDRVRRNYHEPFSFTETGWCSHCGFYTSKGMQHVCPDGTKPIRIVTGPTAQQTHDMWLDGTKGMR